MIRQFRCVVLLALVLASTGFALGDRLAWPLVVSVDYGRPEDGPQGWRREMESWLISNLDAERCYQSVRMVDTPAPADAYLRVEVVVVDFEERQAYDVAQSTVLDPDQPPDVRQAYTLRAEAQFRVRFAVMPEDLTLRQKKFRLTGTHRPTGDEDAQYEVRFQLAQGVLNTVRGMVCKGSAKKLEKEIAKAREGAGD